MGALLDLKVFLGTPAPDDFEDDYLTAVYAMKAPGEDWVKQSFDDKPSLRQGNKTFWHKNDEKHRDGDKPAYVSSDSPYGNFHIIEKEWYSHGILHREGDKPAKIVLRKNIDTDNNSIRYDSIFTYYKNGVIHRDGDKPASLHILKEYDMAGNLVYVSIGEVYFRDGKFHRDGDKPAVIDTITRMTHMGEVKTNEDLKFYKNGVIHRDGDKPAVVEIKRSQFTGVKQYDSKTYVVTGRVHREGDKPAVVIKKRKADSSGSLLAIEKGYYYHGSLHRDNNKPAFLGQSQKKKMVIYAKYGEFDCEDKPAVSFTEFVRNEDSNYEPKTFYYQFYSAGVKTYDKEKAVSFLSKEIAKHDSSVEGASLVNVSVSQLESIVNTVTGVEYTHIIDEGDVFDEIVNTRKARV